MICREQQFCLVTPPLSSSVPVTHTQTTSIQHPASSIQEKVINNRITFSFLSD